MKKSPTWIADQWWQVAFLVASMTWLLAPAVNQQLSYRATLISQYETSGQPLAWLFRIGDLVAAGLLLAYVWFRRRHFADHWLFWPLLIVGIGMVIDPIVTTSCVVQNHICHEPVDSHSVAHGIETLVTVAAFFIVTARDAYKRRLLPSIGMVGLQVVYGLFFASQLARADYNTLTQYVYQCASLLWLAWLCVDYHRRPALEAIHRVGMLRRVAAVGVAVGGITAIISSLASIRLLGHIDSVYLDSSTAWLAQHGVIVGVILVYLSRHVLRGEQRARRLVLAVLAIETIRYALILPHSGLMVFYFSGFVLLFVSGEDFQRGAGPLNWRIRLRDLGYMLFSLFMAAGIGLLLLTRDNRVTRVTYRAFDNFSDYVMLSAPEPVRRLSSVLLVHTVSIFFLSSAVAILWILFRPSRAHAVEVDLDKVSSTLRRYSRSSEDYFKFWPADKSYFWDSRRRGFVAYKIVGSIVFALADPVGPAVDVPRITSEFIAWSRQQRRRVCFLPVSEANQLLYDGLQLFQVGASAVIDTKTYVEHTSRSKWWRWKRNRATKQGLQYQSSSPPHSQPLFVACKRVSDDWLRHGGHQERGFALGYYDEKYLQASKLHYLTDSSGTVVAFVNQLPAFRKLPVATIDLLRYTSEAQDSMPYLLFSVIDALHNEGCATFDLGFVPFAATKNQLLTIAATLSAGRFSSKGLEQFKNKFEPDWQPNYIAYDGDITDLALIALNLDKAMRLS